MEPVCDRNVNKYKLVDSTFGPILNIHGRSGVADGHMHSRDQKGGPDRPTSPNAPKQPRTSSSKMQDAVFHMGLLVAPPLYWLSHRSSYCVVCDSTLIFSNFEIKFGGREVFPRYRYRYVSCRPWSGFAVGPAATRFLIPSVLLPLPLPPRMRPFLPSPPPFLPPMLIRRTFDSLPFHRSSMLLMAEGGRSGRGEIFLGASQSFHLVGSNPEYGGVVRPIILVLLTLPSKPLPHMCR